MTVDAALAVLDTQVDTLRWLRTRLGERWLDVYLHGQKKVDRIVDLRHGNTGRAYADNLARYLDRSTTYWVSPDMTALVGAAWESLPVEPLPATDLPSECGWAEFAESLWVPQPDPDVTQWPRFDAVSWAVHPAVETADQVTGPGVLLAYWERTKNYEADQQRWGSPAAEIATFDGLIGPTPMIPVHVTAWAFDNPWPHFDRAGEMQRLATRALWLLLAQELPAVRRVQPPRGQARRVGRLLAHVPEVVVVDLRRHHPPAGSLTEPEQEAVLWSHRWIVGGHWRNQWYPSEQTHRRAWIAPYEKGPEHLPLLVKDRVYRLVR